MKEMTIIEMATRPDGGHGLQSQSNRSSCWLDGYIAVPQELEQKAWDSLGYCDLVIEDGVLVDIIPTEKPTPPDPEPTELEKLRADIDYLSIMTGVEL